MHQKVPTYLEVFGGREGWILHREYLRRGDFLNVSGLLALFLKQNLDCMFDTWQKFQKSSPKWWFDHDFSWVKKITKSPCNTWKVDGDRHSHWFIMAPYKSPAFGSC